MTDDPTESGDGEGRQAVTAEFDWHQEDPIRGIVETVGRAADVDPMTLDPLHARIETDALVTLLEGAARGPDPASVRVTLTWLGCVVTVGADGAVEVRPDGGA
jgi:hypothetical protein